MRHGLVVRVGVVDHRYLSESGFWWVEAAGFPLDRYPVQVAHADRVRARPAFQATLAREQAALKRAAVRA